METSRYLYPLCIQLPALPLEEGGMLESTLAQLCELGYYGAELNLTDFSDAAAGQLDRLLSRYGLRLSMVASGGWAKQNGYSLSSPDETVRRASVEGLRRVLEFAAGFGAGVICGFLKGGPEGEYAAAASQLRRSLEELAAAGLPEGAPLYLEATNHYEARLVNTLAEGAGFVQACGGSLCILPDTYHMNIEEQNMFAALAAHRALFRNLHLSDNNRFYPGFGGLDFCAVLRFLQGMGYEGSIAVEGRNYGSLAEDIAFTSSYLAQAARCAALQVRQG